MRVESEFSLRHDRGRTWVLRSTTAISSGPDASEQAQDRLAANMGKVGKLLKTQGPPSPRTTDWTDVASREIAKLRKKGAA